MVQDHILVIEYTSHIRLEVFIYTLTESIMDLVITDILILSKKERAPDHFTTVCLIHDVYCLWLG